MKTPLKLSPAEFSDIVEKYLVERCTQTNSAFFCKECGDPIQSVTAYISIHDSRFGDCSGKGEVRRVAIPYCPKCESEPGQYGCLHEEAAKPIHQSLGTIGGIAR